MRSPFKFLDPFTIADKDVFFGRDKETQQLYRQVLRTRLLLLYGLSGTGKTSLIQCGLGNKFDGPDWLPLWIRHQADINESLQASINRLLPAAEGEITDQIRQLYQHFLRPVYLIFDQFEELFILGTQDERVRFVKTLKAILDIELPCTVLLVIREEYLGRLYPFEKAIPSLFDFRLRVEPMDNANVKIVLRKSFQKFNISVEELATEPREARLDEIIQNVSRERSRIELPYLQVYLDQLYREDYERTYPDQTTFTSQSWLPIEFTKDEIEKFGTIDKVLDKFLDEQIQVIQNKLFTHDPATLPDTVKLVLDGFVSDEGTKRPVRYVRMNGNVVIDRAQQDFFPQLAVSILTICLSELEKAKILRSEYDVIEIAHDSLAQIIYTKRDKEQVERNNIKRQIQYALVTFPNTKEYLTRNQLARFENILQYLPKAEKTFFLESRQARQDEEKLELEKERERSSKLEEALETAKAAKEEADKQAKIARENQEKAELAKIKVDTFLEQKQHIIDALYFFKDRFALALQKIGLAKKYGFIDKNGDPVIEYEYDEATTFDDYDGYARVKKNEEKYLLNIQNTKYSLAQDISELNEQIYALDLHDKPLANIDSSVFDYTQLKILLLYNISSLKHIPVQIERLTNLQELNLSYTALTTIPEQIGKLINLLILDLEGTILTDLPKQIGELNNLLKLNLNNTWLKSWPAQIERLTNLQELSLKNTALPTLPSQIAKLTNLQILDISDTKVTALPTQIGELKRLQELNLNSTSLTDLPEQIGELNNLLKLNLNNTWLKSWPAQIERLTNLQELSLKNTALPTLPSQIAKLTNLQILDISDTKVTALPTQIGELKRLQELNLNSTSLTDLPEQIGELNNLLKLNLNDTALAALPMQIGELKNLQELNLSRTRLTSLPPQVGELKRLRKLELNRTGVTCLPEQIKELKSLQDLNLIHTELIKLPSQIGELKSLQTLNLNYTKIKILPVQIGGLKRLQRLDLISTNLTILPAQIGELENLQELNLSRTQLTALPEQISELKRLQKLDLSYTKITNLPEQVRELINLQKIDLQNTLISYEEKEKIRNWLPKCIVTF